MNEIPKSMPPLAPQTTLPRDVKEPTPLQNVSSENLKTALSRAPFSEAELKKRFKSELDRISNQLRTKMQTAAQSVINPSSPQDPQN